MAVEFKRDSGAKSEDVDDRRRREAERTREEFGIATLTDDEELIDDETFSRMHDRLVMARPAASAGGEAAALDRASNRSVEADEADELLLEEIATVLPEPTQVATSPASGDCRVPKDAAAVALLEFRLLDAKGRDEVAEITLSVARYHAAACALFVVNKGLVAGLRGSGGGLEERVEGIMIPSDAEGTMANALQSLALVRASAPWNAVHQRILRAMGREEVHHFACLPIVIADRVVNLLYVDGGDAPLAETSLGALRVLCKGVGRVYERLIVERKQQARA